MNLLTEEEIFAAAIQKPSAERAAFLDRPGEAVKRGQCVRVVRPEMLDIEVARPFQVSSLLECTFAAF